MLGSDAKAAHTFGDAPRRNVELKARLSDLDVARRTAKGLTAEPPIVERQVDTYFHCRRGRLKLREINESAAVLISYARADQAEAKPSDYRLAGVSRTAEVKSALAAALGVKVVVRKWREIFLHGQVRIHLDQVDGLGSFLEFEAVLDDAFDEHAAHLELGNLRQLFGVGPADLLDGSYADLLAASESANFGG